ncbi:MAG: hypothetical protein A2017_01650 [Lentisphaerae bacterium GWF2_44_16]|nr:MAG: hypothetical protein A2017_01650 [Lentisphaerae bacterium GWF2_44_16]
MPGDEGHSFISKAAVENLPLWIKKHMGKELENFYREYCIYGDRYLEKDIEPYVRLPDGRLSVENFNFWKFQKDAPGIDWFIHESQLDLRKRFEYYISVMIDCLQKNRIVDLAKYYGVLAHFIEDACVPAHSVGVDISMDMRLINMIYPPPPSKRGMVTHALLENGWVPFRIKHKPSLLGLNPEEMAMNIFEKVSDAIEYSVSLIIPVLDAFYRNKEQKRKEILSESGKLPAQIISDIIYSVYSTVYAKIKDAERKKLEKVPLSDITPVRRSGWGPAPYFYRPIRKWYFATYGDTSKAIFRRDSLTLNMDGTVKKFKKGIATGAPFRIDYILPEHVYNSLSSLAGMHSRLGAKTKVKFKVIGDGKLVQEEICLPPNGVCNFTASIAGIRELSLITELVNCDMFNTNNNHALWCCPYLLK